MLKQLINQIREQIWMGRMKRQLRQAQLDRYRYRHRRRHPEKTETPSD